MLDAPLLRSGQTRESDSRRVTSLSIEQKALRCRSAHGVVNAKLLPIVPLLPDMEA
jgi:hypothetical protein